MRRSVYLVAGCVGLSLLGGCLVPMPGQWEGGSLYSQDKHVYISRAHTPTTVSVVDTRSQETIWTQDVPVGQQLVVRFFARRTKDNAANPDEMRWGLCRAGGTARFPDENRLAVPGASARQLKVDYRTAPEYPPGAEAQASTAP
jgi:hypothetical protein